MSHTAELILEQIQSLITHLETTHHDQLTDDLMQQLAQLSLSAPLSLSVTECHVINYIGGHSLTNAVTLATNLNITRGGISKITARLQKKGLIQSHQLEGNKKEIFYRLTHLGKTVYSIHYNLHQAKLTALRNLLHSYTVEEQHTLSRFLADLSHHL